MFLVRRRDGEERSLVRGLSLDPTIIYILENLLGQVGVLGVGPHVLGLELPVPRHLPLNRGDGMPPLKNTLQKAHRTPSACSDST